ncbi:MAG: MFS transporter [Dehalococcoidia bacterium]|nr:MFS transporter [Dehalococcoidia bacterium]
MRFRAISLKWQTLIAVGFGTFMATMDFSIVNVALPTFSDKFNKSPDVVVWAALGSSLVVTGLTLTAGRAGDLYGRKRIYLAGWVIFTLGVTGASFAQSLEQVIAWRLFQAVGISMAIANANAIVTDAFPDTERGRALGTVTSIVGAGLMSGPIVGGFLLGIADWRAIFYARIPIGVLAIGMALRYVREGQAPPVADRRMDIPGALLLFAAVAASLTAINRGQAWGWTSPVILGLLGGSAVAFALFVVVETRSVSPVIALTLFRIRSFAVSLASLVLNFVGQSAVIFLMPFYLLEVRGLSTMETGLVLAMVPLMLLLFAPLSGWLFDRSGWTHQATLGVALVSAGLLSLSTIQADTHIVFVLARLALVGLGSVIFNPPNTSTIMGSVPRASLGTASASVATSRNVGNAAGLAVASAVLVAVAGGVAGVSAGDLPEADLLRGIRAAFLVAGLLSLLAVAASSTRGANLPAAQRAPAAPSSTPPSPSSD